MECLFGQVVMSRFAQAIVLGSNRENKKPGNIDGFGRRNYLANSSPLAPDEILYDLGISKL